VEPETLAEWIRPAGYFRLKTQRLKAFVGVLVDEYEGEVSCLMVGESSQVRLRLLNIHGIGPETADSMMLYAGGHAIFVVDAYTRRIFSRHGWCHPQAPYHTLQEICQNGIQAWQSSSESRVEGWKDYHAQLVQIGKDFCRPRNPKCDLCPLQSLL
jgi:endonuclease-3 related protein